MGGSRVGRPGVRLAAEPGDHPRLLARGRQCTLRECLEAELALTRTIIRTPDFLEGPRAALVDKDRTPTWQRASLGGRTLPS
nr:enoyl-CoA hydratase/isomerase family protein [Streptomyces lincolnensis]